MKKGLEIISQGQSDLITDLLQVKN